MVVDGEPVVGLHEVDDDSPTVGELREEYGMDCDDDGPTIEIASAHTIDGPMYRVCIEPEGLDIYFRTHDEAVQFVESYPDVFTD